MITPEYLLNFFQIKNSVLTEMLTRHIKSIDFDVFQVRDLTNQHELTTTIAFILSQEDIFNQVPLRFDTFVRFSHKISQGYLSEVPYHNKTHGTDLA